MGGVPGRRAAAVEERAGAALTGAIAIRRRLKVVKTESRMCT
jgi:hypothetical protein